MNLLGKGTISAALFAATASVVVAAPAQAFTIGDGFRFLSIPLNITDNGGGVGDYTFDFGANGAAPGSGTIIEDLGGGFVVGDAFVIKDIVEPGQPPITDWLTGIDYGIGQQAKFDLASMSYTVNGGFLNLMFSGVLKDSADGTFLSKGSFTLTNLVLGVNNAAVGELTVDVPTPAAVLPVIGGLLGMASKRKRNEEENA